MSKYIEHDGIIIAQLSAEKYAVKITQQSACASCHAAQLCSAADNKEKVIEAFAANTPLAVGNKVVVYGRLALGYRALLLGVVLPMLVAFVTLLLATHITHNELVGGIAALAILVPYYVVLRFFRHTLQRTFVFYIKPLI